MSNSFKGPAGYKQASWADKGKDVDEAGNQISGFCAFCRNWDAELKDGYCRDRECKEKREDSMIRRGEAVRVCTDIINSQTGKLSTRIEKGDEVQFFDKETDKAEDE